MLKGHEKTAANRWGLAMALYMTGFISYGATLALYAANFPRLARNTQHLYDLRERYDHGEMSVEVYEREESLEKNRISNISTVSAAFDLLPDAWAMTCSGRHTAISAM
jgi:Atg22-like efflux protein